MTRPLAVALAAGAALGVLTPVLYGRGRLPDVLVMEGLFLAAAWGLGRLAAGGRAGAACGAAFATTYYAGRELMPWLGVEAQARAEGLDAVFARHVRDIFDASLDVNLRVAVVAVVLAAAAGARHRLGWALFAGALMADLATAAPHVGGDPASIVAVAAAVAGAAVAAHLARPRWTLVAALLPIAAVWVGPHLLGSDVVGGLHPEISVIR